MDEPTGEQTKEAETPLLEVAKILLEHGDRMSPQIIADHRQQLEAYSRLPENKRIIGIYNPEAMSQVLPGGTKYGDGKKVETRTCITLFLGPQTTNQEEFVEYPRVAFYYRGDPADHEHLELSGLQVGVRGYMTGPRAIVYKHRQSGKVNRALLEQLLNPDDVIRILGKYMTDPEQKQLPPQIYKPF